MAHVSARLLASRAPWCAHGWLAGQGLITKTTTSLGASVTYTSLQQQYQNSLRWKLAYKLAPASACAGAGSATLCGSASADLGLFAQLLLATSPQAYASNNLSDTGGFNPVTSAKDQRPCNTCTAFAVSFYMHMQRCKHDNQAVPAGTLHTVAMCHHHKACRRVTARVCSILLCISTCFMAALSTLASPLSVATRARHG